jgi:hypothetical protein
MFANGRGEILQFIDIEFFARLARVALDKVNGNLRDSTSPSTGFGFTRRNECVESFA